LSTEPPGGPASDGAGGPGSGGGAGSGGEVPWPMRFGIFLAPFHRVGENPTLALQRDLELIATLDGLGYDEAWVGEHHSGGWETIAAPELFIAAAAERTRHIRLGTGVTSLPYHHPYMVAQRMVLLDHLTRGRVMLGVGPGALVTDAMMLGIDPQTLRPRMAEALDVILRLLTSVEPLTYSGEWFSLREAVLQLRPYTRPHFPVAVASTASPAGMTLAGRHGLRVLQLGPAMGVRGAVDLKAQWAIGEAAAAAAGQTLRRDEWSLVIPMHLAETRREAFQSARHGAAAELLDYFGTVLGRPCPVEGPRERVIEQMADSGTWIVGTPDDCVAGIRRYQEATGGFGGVLLWAHEWAAPDATRRSYELLARYVMPRFQGSLRGVEASASWAAGHAAEFRARAQGAVEAAHRAYESGQSRA
jgi:limonene 1,2-monooxygenase